MNIPSWVLLFAKETITRLKTKSPRFFYFLQIIAACLVVAAYGIIGLHEIGMKVNATTLHICEIIGNIAFGLGLGSALTVNGTAQQDAKKLPFTHQKKDS